MSDDETKLFPRNLLQRILTKLEVMDNRLQLVESKIEQHGFDTKPIWEQALSEIVAVKHELASVKHELANMNRKIDLFSRDILNVRAEQTRTDELLRRLVRNESGGLETIP